jgi:hypothetical protein
VVLLDPPQGDDAAGGADEAVVGGEMAEAAGGPPDAVGQLERGAKRVDLVLLLPDQRGAGSSTYPAPEPSGSALKALAYGSARTYRNWRRRTPVSAAATAGSSAARR